MANHRVIRETGQSQFHHHQNPFPMMLHHHPIANTSFINQGRTGYNFGGLEEAVAVDQQRGVNIMKSSHRDETKQPALYHSETLRMFPSLPMRFQQQNTPMSGEGSSDSRLEPESPISQKSFSNRQASIEQNQAPRFQTPQPQEMEMASGSGGRVPQASGSGGRVPQAQQAKQQSPTKILRRLAQNREAAKKSRLRKKAYVQQLESSRIRLAQLEQDLHRARSQGLFLGASGNISTGAMFDKGYERWLDDDQKYMADFRTALQNQLSDNNLMLMLEGYVAHYDEIFELKNVAAKSDAIHIITGSWTSPTERCFLWMGGFRPSDLIKILVPQLQPLTEQQALKIHTLQHCSLQAEEALSQGLEQLQQSVIATVASPASNNMQHMAHALGKLATLEGFVRQADHLRQQMIHQLPRILTLRQSIRCFLVIGEYYGRLRALSTLWASRPRERLIPDNSSCQTTSDLQMVQSSQNQFSNY